MTNYFHNKDVETLHFICTGLEQLQRTLERKGETLLPHPATLQRGINRFAVACLSQGETPPAGLPEFLKWCHRPFGEWPLELSNFVSPESCLLEEGQLTDTCFEWACQKPDIEAELTERHLMLGALGACRSANAQESYIAFRQLLISSPVLTAFELQKARANVKLEPVREYLAEAYEPVSGLAVNQGKIQCCTDCGDILLPNLKGKWHCECGGVKTSKTTPFSEQPLRLKRGLQRYVMRPGKTELELATFLETLPHLKVELWPEFDQYDLRLTFPDGEVWAVDVKDWSNPFLLGHKVTPFQPYPSWQRAFFVFPDKRHKERSDYVRAFKSVCPWLKANRTTSALMLKGFRQSVQKKLQSKRESEVM